MDAIMDKIEANLCVDTTQRYTTGFSYGAVPWRCFVCGAQLSGCDGGSKPVAFWSTHGIFDNVLPISMGRALRDHFLQVNGCQAKNAPEPTSGQDARCRSY
ncbi:hypothetical protein Ae201684P_017328 [Aphanomyces euteiches]|nr:hypothetical protein Ae201684P_017328 [Aphanomyces euteiches]